MKIVVLDGFAANPGDLSWEPFEAFGEVTVYDRTAPAEVISRIGHAEVVITNKVVLSEEVFRACPSIRFVCECATGYNNIDIAAARERGIPVSNVPAYSSASVAQMVFSFLLEIAHRVASHSDAVHQGRWTSCNDFCFLEHPIFELEGKTLGIIGYGDIGKKVATIAVSFGMNVLACSRTYRPELSTEHINIVTQDEVLKGSDIITLHCPQNPESQGLICRDTIARMKDGAIVINTARGGCVIEQEVREALESGKLAFYAADVLSTEPPRADNPLLGAPNAFITPHIAWMTIEARTRLLNTMLSNLKAFLDGTPINVVNP